MKLKAAALLSVALAGCASTEKVTQPKPADVCSIVAEQHRRNGELNGYDREMQKASYSYFYVDCVKWNLAHGVNY